MVKQRELLTQEDTVAERERAEPAPTGSAHAVLQLVAQWLTDRSGYDEAVWPVIERDIEENRLSDRSRFHA